MFDASLKVWHNGQILSWNDSTIHVASHCVHYGSSVFEGIRGYRTKKGLGIFRLNDHLQRLLDSATVYQMNVPFSVEELRRGCFELLELNVHEHPYIRPIIFRGYGALGVDPRNSPIETYMLSWNWGAYLGAEALESGVDVCVSSWRRPSPDAFPAMAKAGANYMNSQLIKMEAVADGYNEGIALDFLGNVSEGSGENIFVVYHGKLLTPPLCSCILPGITRDCVLRIASDLEIPWKEEVLPREILHIADEVFFSGTAAEITPIRSINHRTVGKGKPGPITKAIQNEFMRIISGTADNRHGWLDYGDKTASPAKKGKAKTAHA
jgi:branched-chain amino acid aminotransferase